MAWAYNINILWLFSKLKVYYYFFTVYDYAFDKKV